MAETNLLAMCCNTLKVDGLDVQCPTTEEEWALSPWGSPPDDDQCMSYGDFTIHDFLHCFTRCAISAYSQLGDQLKNFAGDQVGSAVDIVKDVATDLRKPVPRMYLALTAWATDSLKGDAEFSMTGAWQGSVRLRVECARAGRGALEVLDNVFEMMSAFVACYVKQEDNTAYQMQLRMLAVTLESLRSILMVHAVGSQSTFSEQEFNFLMRFQDRLLRNWQHVRLCAPCLVRALCSF